MSETRRLVLAVVVMGATILLASGVALAANVTCVVGVLCEGTNNQDTITGTDEADEIHAKDAADTVSGMAGGDTIYGGHGADKLYAIDANQTPTTGGGNDKIYGNAGDDTILGANGDDELNGGDDNDYIDGDQGTDYIVGGASGDQIYGDEHDDNEGDIAATGKISGLYPGPGADTVDGGPGDDKIVANYPANEGGQDTIYGGSEDDRIYVANKPADKDVVYCGGGYDKVIKDNNDVVADDCEDVRTASESAQQIQEEGRKYHEGVAAFERHMTVGSDGELNLDSAGLDQETVDPAVRDHLLRSLDNTNQRIRHGEVTASDVFPRSSAKRTAICLRCNSGALSSASPESAEFAVLQFVTGSYYSDPWDGPTITLTPADIDYLSVLVGTGGGLTTGALAVWTTLPPGVIYLVGSMFSLDVLALQTFKYACGDAGVEFTAAVDPLTGVPLGTGCA